MTAPSHCWTIAVLAQNVLKVEIAGGVAALGYIVLQESMEGELHSLAGPTVIICLLGWFASGMFMSVLDMAIVTILQCFVADEEMFEEQLRYAGSNLKKCIHIGAAGGASIPPSAVAPVALPSLHSNLGEPAPPVTSPRPANHASPALSLGGRFNPKIVNI